MIKNGKYTIQEFLHGGHGAAPRLSFVDFETDVKRPGTVGLNADSDIGVYVCDDREELERLGPRDNAGKVPGINGFPIGGSPMEEKIPGQTLLTGGEGLFAQLFPDGSPEGHERPETSGAGSPLPGRAESPREIRAESHATMPDHDDMYVSGGGNRSAKPAPATKPGKGAWGRESYVEAHWLRSE